MLHVLSRPATLDEFYGNYSTVNLLKKIIADPNKPHVLLFTGPSGCGKTTLATIVAQSLGATPNDIIEIDASTDRGIETSRQIIEHASSVPYFSSVKVFIIDECHKTTSTFQNSMLKTLENPPSHAYFLLCTTEPDKLIPTLRRRCATFSVKKLRDTEVYDVLKRTVQKFNISLVDKSILDLIVSECGGSPGLALMLLNTIQHASSFEEASTFIRSSNITTTDEFKQLVTALLENKPWGEVSKILENLEVDDYEQFRKGVLSYCAKVLLSSQNAQAAKILEIFKTPFYDGKPNLVLACFNVVKRPVRSTVL